jgi:hypothetical protein
LSCTCGFPDPGGELPCTCGAPNAGGGSTGIGASESKSDDEDAPDAGGESTGMGGSGKSDDENAPSITHHRAVDTNNQYLPTHHGAATELPMLATDHRRLPTLLTTSPATPDKASPQEQPD